MRKLTSRTSKSHPDTPISLTQMHARWICLIFIFSVPWTASTSEPIEDKRSLALDLEEIEGAVNYQIEVRQINGRSREKQYVFTSPKPTFNIRLRPGRYELRLRAADERKVYGEWSESSPLIVTPPDVPLMLPIAGARLFQHDSEQIEFQWQQVPGMEQYWLIVEDHQGNNILREKVSAARTQKKLKAGQSYRWYVLAEDRNQLQSAPPTSLSDFTYIGKSPTAPDFTEQTLISTHWKSQYPIEKVNVELKQLDGTVPKLIRKTQGKAADQLIYTLEDQQLYSLSLQGEAALFDPTKTKTIYFERRRQDLIVYGESRPTPAERLASKKTRWLVQAMNISNSFSGNNTEYGHQTEFKGALGLGARVGVIHQRTSFDHTAEIAYSNFSAGNGSSNLSVNLLGIAYKTVWRRNLAFERLPLYLTGGALYDEAPEFIGVGQLLALQFLRTINVTAGFAIGFQFTKKTALRFHFDLVVPIIGLQVPEGKLKTGGGGKLGINLYRDFSVTTVFGGIEIQGRQYTYGSRGHKFDFSSAGIGIGLMF